MSFSGFQHTAGLLARTFALGVLCLCVAWGGAYAGETAPLLNASELSSLEPEYEAFLNKLADLLIQRGLLSQEDREDWFLYQMGDYYQNGGYGMIAGFLFGWLMDLVFWPYALGGQTELSYDPSAGLGENLHHFLLFNIATSMGWNLGRAIANAVLVLITGPSLLRLLRRSARGVQFLPAAD